MSDRICTSQVLANAVDVWVTGVLTARRASSRRNACHGEAVISLASGALQSYSSSDKGLLCNAIHSQTPYLKVK